MTVNSTAVAKRRRKVKAILVAEHSGKCLDCGITGPDYIFDFDHRDPTEKLYRIGNGNTYSLEAARLEASKCDLVCANCHRIRTHKQRCNSCEDCHSGDG